MNPAFGQLYNEPVDTVREEDMEPQVMEAPPLQPGPHRVAIKRENINVVRQCEWDVKSMKDDSLKEKPSLGRPLVTLIGVLCITSVASLLLTLLILFGSVGTRNCSCGGNQEVGSTSALKSVDDDRIVKVSENMTTLDQKMEKRILQVERINEEKERQFSEEMSKLKDMLQKQREEQQKEKFSQEKKLKNLTDHLESIQRELKSLRVQLSGQMTGLWKTTNSTTVQLNKLESVWVVVNATAEKTSNLTHKIGQEFKTVKRSVHESNGSLNRLMSSLQDLKLKINDEMETVWLKLNQSRKCCAKLRSSFGSLKANVTYRSERLEARIDSEEQKSNNTKKVTELHFKKIQDLENLLNSTRQNAQEVSRQHFTAIWAAGNLTMKEFHRVWAAMNTSQNSLVEKLREVKDNLTEQLNLTTVSLQSDVASLRASLVDLNASVTVKVNNVSKMTGPVGPPGFNGSQGPAGPAGSIGVPGPKGAGDFSACQYKIVTEKETPGDPTITAALAEPNGKRVLGVSCSTNYAAEYNLASAVRHNVRRYSCNCKGTSTLFSSFGGQEKSCSIHYWECPLTS